MPSSIELLCDAAKKNDYESFCRMYQKVGAEEIISFRIGGWNFLHLSANFSKGDTKIFSTLLRMMDPNGKNHNRPSVIKTPLFIASHKGHSDVVRLLVEDPRVDPNLAQDNNQTPLYVASRMGRSSIVKMLVENPKVDPNVKSMNGCTPLYVASQNGHFDVVKMLLDDLRTDPNIARNSDKATPLHAASQNGHSGVVKMLLDDQRVNPNIVGVDNHTPLYVASEEGHYGVLKTFLRDQSESQYRK
eukprot:TRINITY_DN5636_c0_g1_i5.p1 TRINITY_DN5636_c0_g1~~TRINITY_DN5636_c0_g1_i5.p1  ORF type:complete len:245 (-),score=34.08 TRINITY_DN5636_c0_g1_i5:550-1284(-)